MDDKPTASVTEAPLVEEPKVLEPTPSTTSTSDVGSNPDNPASSTSAKATRDTSTAPSSTAKRLGPPVATSSTTSPKQSRENSPIRPSQRQGSTTRTPVLGRSRKNSKNESSPTRSVSTTAVNPPSAAAVQRGLSHSTIPHLQPTVSDAAVKAPTPQKPQATNTETPKWPTSPRLRSPPPVNRPQINTSRKPEDHPSLGVQRSSSSLSTSSTDRPSQTDTDDDESTTPHGMRTPIRGASGVGSTLETVQELSQPSTPAIAAADGAADETWEETRAKMLAEQNTQLDRALTKSLKAKANGGGGGGGTTAANESESESGGKGDMKMRTTSAPPVSLRPNAPPAVKTYNPPAGMGRGKPGGEGSTQNMTVETEVVSSVPQVAVGAGAGAAGNNGSVRAKPSSETIRPKKDKKKPTRKTPSVTAGTASSKADIFEAKIASAVDEADSTDSEETFVYESNPPDTNDRPRRYHSRTPSATSMASQMDQRSAAIRGMHGATMDGGHTVAMKKSMKFANSYNINVAADSTLRGGGNGGGGGGGDYDEGKGTVRSSAGTGRGAAHHHHHHIGRWGRSGGGGGGGNGHPSLFDSESPFPNAAKSKLDGGGGGGGNNSRHSSQPSSPRMSHSRAAADGKRMQAGGGGGGYDLAYDTAGAADDEQTPLLIPSSMRSARLSARGARRTGGGNGGSSGFGSNNNNNNTASMRRLEHQASRRQSDDGHFLTRCAGCLVVGVTVLLVVLGAAGLMFATTTPLADVRVVRLANVLASRQELILDLVVSARNPNVVAVTIDSMDMEVFARSKFLDADWRTRDARGEEAMGPAAREEARRRGRMARRGVGSTRTDMVASTRTSEGRSGDRDGNGNEVPLHATDDDPLDPPAPRPTPPNGGSGGGDDDDDDNPEETATTIRLGRIVDLDSPLLFEGSPLKHVRATSVGEVRLARPGNGSDEDGSGQWARALQHEFELILRGTLRYSLPLSGRVRSVPVTGRRVVREGGGDGGEDGAKGRVGGEGEG